MLTTRPRRPRWATPRATATRPLEVRSVEELLLDAGTGDQRAFATLSDHLAGLVYLNIRRALRDTTCAETVAEEALSEVWRQAARFDPSSTPAVIWILDLAHQLATQRDQDDHAVAAAGPRAERATADERPGGGPSVSGW